LKQQAEVGDIVLLSADESEALTHPYLAHAWSKRGADLRVPAPGQSRKLALLGALDHAAGKLIVQVSDAVQEKFQSDWTNETTGQASLKATQPASASR